MKFTLLFYTEGWEVGSTVELSHIPSPGSVIWVGGRRRDEEELMYYVDNVMYPERGLDREDIIYLYVRPYNGYTKYAPKTEADRLVEKLDEIKTAVMTFNNAVDQQASNNRAVLEELASIREVLAKSNDYNQNIGDQILQLFDAVEDGQQAEIGKLDDISLILEQIKDQL